MNKKTKFLLWIGLGVLVIALGVGIWAWRTGLLFSSADMAQVCQSQAIVSGQIDVSVAGYDRGTLNGYRITAYTTDCNGSVAGTFPKTVYAMTNQYGQYSLTVPVGGSASYKIKAGKQIGTNCTYTSDDIYKWLAPGDRLNLNVPVWHVNGQNCPSAAP